MRRIELDVRCIHTVKALHVYLAYKLDLPVHYGCNLDALYDVLSTESEQAEITLKGPAAAGSEIESYLPRLISVFEDCAQENSRIAFALKA